MLGWRNRVDWEETTIPNRDRFLDVRHIFEHIKICDSKDLTGFAEEAFDWSFGPSDLTAEELASCAADGFEVR